MSNNKHRSEAIVRAMAEHFDEYDWGIYSKENNECDSCSSWISSEYTYCSQCGSKLSIKERKYIDDKTAKILFDAYLVGRKAAKKYKRENK